MACSDVNPLRICTPAEGIDPYLLLGLGLGFLLVQWSLHKDVARYLHSQPPVSTHEFGFSKDLWVANLGLICIYDSSNVLVLHLYLCSYTSVALWLRLE